MSIFSSPVSTGWSNWYPHCQLSLSIRVDSVYPCCNDPKMGIQYADTTISANSHSPRMPLAVNVCFKTVSIQRYPWNQFTLSITAGTVADMRPMVPSCRPFIDQRVRGCSMPQSCMQFAHCAQWNSVLQRAYPHPYHVKKHTGSITATSSSMGPLCTPVCSHPIKDSDRAVCCSLATSLFDHTVLSSISLSSPMWIQIIKPLVGSSERVAGICRSVWSCVSDSMFGPWCDPTSPGEARPSSACVGGYAQNLGRAFGITIPPSFDSPVTTTVSLPLFGVPTYQPPTRDAKGYAENLAGASILAIPSSFDSSVTMTASLNLESTASAKAKSLGGSQHPTSMNLSAATTELFCIGTSSPMCIQIIKPSVGSSERVAGICRSVWSCVSDSMFGPWCDSTSPGEAPPSSASVGGYAQNLGRDFGIAIPSSFDSPVTTTASLPLFGVPTYHPRPVTLKAMPKIWQGPPFSQSHQVWTAQLP